MRVVGKHDAVSYCILADEVPCKISNERSLKAISQSDFNNNLYSFRIQLYKYRK